MSKLSKLPKRRDLDVYRGDTLSIPFRISDESGPLDLTGYTIRAQVRKTRLSSTAEAEFLVVVTDAADGRFSLVMAASVVATIPCGETPASSASRHYWDVQLTDADDVTTTTHAGAFVLSADVTRSA